MTGSSSSSLESIIDQVVQLCDGQTVTLGELIASFGRASLVPPLMLPALLVVSPLSGIPLFSSACGLIIALISVQMVLHRHKLWLPQMLARRELSTTRLKSAVKRIRPGARWLDRHSRRRIVFLERQPFVLLPQVACMMCGLAMPFLELVPFSSSLLALAVCLLALGMLVEDGLLTLVGLIPIAGAVSIIATIWS
ncbi:MAG: exopolysaccharide biosynthesis protein [Pseudomonadota bacterium]